MARRRRIRGMSTGTTVALVGGGVVVLYLLMKKNATTITTAYNPALIQAQAQTAQTQQITSAAASVANNLINSIFS